MPPPSRKSPPPSPRASASTKQFSVQSWDGAGEGEKIIAYSGSGMGKTTLASMMPRPLFIGLDDGGRKIRNPLTGDPVDVISGVESFQDVRDALHSPDLLGDHKSLVIDTITRLENLGEGHVVDTIRTDKGQAVKNLEGFGWGKGYRFVLETMRLILADLDVVVKRGMNVMLLAQESAVTIANSEGLDYLQDGPRLMHKKDSSVRADYCEWADHVLRIGFTDTRVAGKDDDRKGKLVSTDTTRCIYATAARHFFAKTRTLTDPVISFEGPADNSLWTLLFGENYA